MARFILLTVLAFIAITFVFVALKGILRRLSGITPPSSVPLSDKRRVLYKNNDVLVLQGEAGDNQATTTTTKTP